MIRRIRAVSRSIKIETEIKRSAAGTFNRKTELQDFPQVWIPAVDIYEKDIDIIVEIELPGVMKKDIKVLLHGTRIEVMGIKEENLAESNVRYHRLEREFGRFHRLVFIPGSIIPEKTSAALENGILTIFLKKHPRRVREVEVKIRKNNQ